MARNLATKPLPSASHLREILAYDQDTGELRWRSGKAGWTKAGRMAGYVDHRGYINVCIGGLTYRAHRLIWAIVTGNDPGHLHIDHINRNTGDNRFSNLRIVPQSLNLQNTSIRKDNSSGFVGVGYSKKDKKWLARLKVGGKFVLCERFDSKDKAIAAREAAAILHHPNRPSKG